MTGVGRAAGTRVVIRPTVACVLGRDDTVATAADEAVRLDARLALITPPGTPPSDVARAARRCRLRAPGLEVLVVREWACRIAACARPPAELVVEPPQVTPGLLDAARTEILVLPGVPAPSGPVVLGLAAWTGERVVRAAVREASTRDADVEVVRAWSDPDVDPGVVRPDVLRRWDVIDARLRADAEERLGRWQHDDGPLRTLVVMDSAHEALALFARSACLLVVGHRTGADPAPLVTLARTVHCPLLIVPDDGEPAAG